MAKPPKPAPPANPPAAPDQPTKPADGSHGSGNPWHPLSATIKGKVAISLDKSLQQEGPKKDADHGGPEKDRRARSGKPDD